MSRGYLGFGYRQLGEPLASACIQLQDGELSLGVIAFTKSLEPRSLLGDISSRVPKVGTRISDTRESQPLGTARSPDSTTRVSDRTLSSCTSPGCRAKAPRYPSFETSERLLPGSGAREARPHLHIVSSGGHWHGCLVALPVFSPGFGTLRAGNLNSVMRVLSSRVW